MLCIVFICSVGFVTFDTMDAADQAILEVKKEFFIFFP